MLLSNPKIDYSTVRRMPTVKLGGQTQGSTMPTSTSLQDINAHTQKFAWNSSTEKDDRLVHFSGQLLSTDADRRLSSSQSDERIFEHPEVTIKPSALDDEIQKRLLTMKSSNTTENLAEREGGRSAPNILEHPDMRAPVVMLSQQLSSSSTSSLIQVDLKRVTRTQSAEPPSTTTRTISPARDDVKFYLTDRDNSKRSSSPGDTNNNSNQEENENLASLTKVSVCEPEEESSKSDVHLLSAKKNESW